MTYQHQALAQGRWFTLTLMEQLGNVGSEVERTIRWRDKHNAVQANQAMERALELLDLTINDPRWIAAQRLQELVRVREVLCDWFYGDNEYHTSNQQWQNYFLYFGMAARLALPGLLK